MMNDSITQSGYFLCISSSGSILKVTQNTHATLGDRDRNVGGDIGLFGTLHTILGATSAIPVPFVKPLVANLLTTV